MPNTSSSYAFFNIGQFALLFSTTILGSGLNLLTHHYLAATAALPGNDKGLVCSGFAGTFEKYFFVIPGVCDFESDNFISFFPIAVLVSTMFIKSMHLKRVPIESTPRALFIGAYVIQGLATTSVAVFAFLLSYSQIGYLQVLQQSDVELMWVPGGETNESIIVWLPQRRIAIVGNLFGAFCWHVEDLWMYSESETFIRDL